ncbi:MAG: alpha/beta hydrolase [Solirubrobacteraceae bacterium]
MKLLARALVPALALCGLLAPSASAAPPFAPCSGTSAFGCGKLAVPLDRSGATGGVVPLSIRRLKARGGDGTSAVIALAGGPGQAATPLADSFVQALAPALSSRDLIVFDQRGTGRSLPLDCAAFRSATASSTAAQVLGRCATQIGAARGHFTTSDSVDDIESIRQALGYSKLVLYGTSYGTKVALDYATRYPTRVERLVLDSTLTQNGPDIFARSTIAAVPGVLRALCGSSDCRRISSDPVGDLQRLVNELRGRTLVGSVVDVRGRRHKIAVSHDDMLDILVAGDEDPTLRASLPGAMRAALDGDPAPLARLRVDALGNPNSPGGGGAPQGIDLPLFYATTCEELAYPWTRSADPSTKLAQLQAAAATLDRSSLLPFDAQSALHSGPSVDCTNWPEATPSAQTFAGPLPAVPTLILSGADDLRTPTADAAAVSAQIPGSQLVVVPNDGHSVIGTDLGNCSLAAVRAFFGSGAVQPCRASRRPSILRPTAVPPLNLAAVGGGSGRAARALAAAALTLLDAKREVELGLVNALSSGLPFNRVRSGGLRAGYAVFNSTGLHLHGYSYVPGVRITGTLARRRGRLSISGRVSGRLTLNPSRTLAGTLAGRQVHKRVRGLGAIAPTARTARSAHHSVWRTP